MSAARDIWASSSKTIISTIPRVFLDENINTTSFTVHLLTAKNLKIALNHLNEKCLYYYYRIIIMFDHLNDNQV